jgi:S1-C subfamily serine protease
MNSTKNSFNNPVVIILLIVLLGLSSYILFSKNKQAPIKFINATDVVNEWNSVVPIIVCNLRDSTGTIIESSQGSGILYQASNGDFSILTNKHVLGKFGVNNNCEIQFPNDLHIFNTTNEDFHPFDDSDAVQIKIKTPNNNLRNLINTSKKRFCSNIPNIGDEIVILGYPGIGASQSITATEGIMSGYDGDYYVTSAKVERGNSGGVAIDVKNNCDLGIPTLVETGSFESLARILKWQVTAFGQEQKALNDKL